MQTTPNPELRGLREQVETALIVAGQNARELAEQTGTRLVVVEPKRTQPETNPLNTEAPRSEAKS